MENSYILDTFYPKIIETHNSSEFQNLQQFRNSHVIERQDLLI